MTAQIENLDGLYPEFFDILGMELDATDGDLNAVAQEGNILGAGELWQRLGSNQGPSVPTESVAIGYAVGPLHPGLTFSPKNNPSVIVWKVTS